MFGGGAPLHVSARVRIPVWPRGLGPFSRAPPQSTGPRFHSSSQHVPEYLASMACRIRHINIHTSVHMWINHNTSLFGSNSDLIYYKYYPSNLLIISLRRVVSTCGFARHHLSVPLPRSQVCAELHTEMGRPRRPSKKGARRKGNPDGQERV